MRIQRPTCTPIGVTPLDDNDRRSVWRVYNGDTLKMRATVRLPWNGEPATPGNSILTFRLSDQRFTPASSSIWKGTWDNGITTVNGTDASGLVDIAIPDAVSASLRRGSFIYSLSVATPLGENVTTVFTGSLLVEYAPTSPLHDIPYHSDSADRESQAVDTANRVYDALKDRLAALEETQPVVVMVDIAHGDASTSVLIDTSVYELTSAIIVVPADGATRYSVTMQRETATGYDVFYSSTVRDNDYKLKCTFMRRND